HLGGTRWFCVDNRLDERSRRMRPSPGRMLSGKNHVKDNAERVNIRRGCNLAPGYLLRSGKLWSQGSSTLVRELRARRIAIIAQQLRNSKIEQFYLAIGSHQYVRGLNVAMHNQVAVRVSDRPEYIEKELDARFNIQLASVAVLIDLLSIHIFENQI